MASSFISKRSLIAGEGIHTHLAAFPFSFFLPKYMYIYIYFRALPVRASNGLSYYFRLIYGAFARSKEKRPHRHLFKYLFLSAVFCESKA